MDAKSKNLDVIFNTTCQLVVPLFQRPYVWKEADNWVPLWESIQEVAERRLENDHARPHFLGAIVVEQIMTPFGDVEQRQVIDGQQRLTTLQVFLAALRDLAASIAGAASDFTNTFDGLTRNKVPGSENKNDEFKVWPTNADREDFKAVVRAGSPEAVRAHFGARANTKRLGHGIPDAYLYFREALDEWFGQEDESGRNRRLKALYRTVVSDLILVVIDLGDEDDAQLIFETLNFRGQPLLPADLVKNYLFHQAAGEKADMQALYEEYWAPFDKEGGFWREKIVQGRLSRPRLDLFLQHYLTRHRQRVMGATHLFAEFKDHHREAERPAIEHVRSIRRYADVFHSMMTADERSPDGVFLSRLKTLDTAMVYPLLLEVFRPEFDPAERRQILIDLESYLVRRQLGVLTTKAYNRQFVDLVRRCEKDGFTAGIVRSFLLGREGDSTKWPTDDELRGYIRQQTVYKRVRNVVIQMVFEAVNAAMHDERSERITIEDKLTVEHILPQRWEQHWPLPGGDAVQIAEAKQRRQAALNTLGNLTLVTGTLNPSLSNSAWDRKREGLRKHTVLALNRQLLERDRWDEDAILERADALFEHIRKIWPRPAEL